MSVEFDFSGRTVLITGGGRGIGRALVRFFADAGATTAVIDVDEQALAESRTRTRRAAVRGRRVEPDGRRHDAIQQLVTDTGRLDVVVNNAGILRDRVVWKLTDSDWHAVIGVHLTGTFNTTRSAVPVMRQQNYGRIVNVTSYTGLHGNVGQSNYAAAKAGIIGFTRTTAKELAGFGITVNTISPNAETDMVASIPPDRAEQLRAAIPMGRFSDPAEVGPGRRLPRQRAGRLHHGRRPPGRRRVVDLRTVEAVRSSRSLRIRSPARSTGRSGAVARPAVG